MRTSEGAGSGDGAVGAWRTSFLRAPYGRDALVSLGCVVDTFETAVTWDRFDELHAGVTAAVEKALTDVCGGGWLTCLDVNSRHYWQTNEAGESRTGAL